MAIDVASSFVVAPDFIGAIYSGPRDGVHCGRSDRPHRPSASTEAGGSSENESVLTPGGRRSRKNVHQIGPDQRVQQNPDGSFSIVPKEAPKNLDRPKPGGERE